LNLAEKPGNHSILFDLSFDCTLNIINETSFNNIDLRILRAMMSSITFENVLLNNITDEQSLFIATKSEVNFKDSIFT